MSDKTNKKISKEQEEFLQSKVVIPFKVRTFEPHKNPPPRVIAQNTQPSITQHHMASEVRLKDLFDRYSRTGDLDFLNTKNQPDKAVFQDFTDFKDYQANMEQLTKLKSEFMLLPAKTRAHFQNDPIKLLEFCSNPKNTRQAVEMEIFPPEAYQPAPGDPAAKADPLDAESTKLKEKQKTDPEPEESGRSTSA